MTKNMEVATNAQKNYENQIKEYLAMTTKYAMYYDFDEDNFKVEANDGYIEIQFHGNQITFYNTGEVKACLENYEFDVDEIGVIKDIMNSDWEVWMMYDSIFKKTTMNKCNDINN